MRITSGGLVGIGTTSPVQKLHVEGSTAIGTTGTEDILLLGRAIGAGASFQQAASLKLGRYQNAGGSFESYTRLDFALRDNSASSNYNTNTTVMTLTNAGNVGIGDTNPSYKLDITNSVAASTSLDPITLRLYNGSDGGSAIYFQNSVGGQSKISFGVESTGAGTDDSYLGFSTGANTALTERMRIASSGAATFTSTLTVANGITVSSNAFGNYFGKFGAASTSLLELREFTGDQTGTTLILRSSRSNSGNLYAHIQAFSDSTTQVFRVLANGVVDNLTGAYGSLSDIKLKENIVDATPKLEDLLKVKIRNYNLIGDENKQIGVIAQELEEIFPGLVSESEDFEEVEITDEEGNVKKGKQSLGTTTKSVKYSIFVPMLIKAIQELKAELDELKNNN
jgi:hypothetical protein